MTNIHQSRKLHTTEIADKIKNLILSSLEQDKAEDILFFPLAGKADFAHYIIIASGRSTKHASSIAENLLHSLKQANYPASVEGLSESHWILIDAFDVVAHIFTPETRKEYSLEEIWGVHTNHAYE